jgi:hypothetical protein
MLREPMSHGAVESMRPWADKIAERKKAQSLKFAAPPETADLELS